MNTYELLSSFENIHDKFILEAKDMENYKKKRSGRSRVKYTLIAAIVAVSLMIVTAVAAIALTAPSREKLLAKLQKMTGKNIVLTETVDPAVLGGLRLDMDGTRLDGTVQRHLERLRTEIDGAVL